MDAGDAVDFRVRLEFRKVLGQVSDGLSSENVEALKHLCYDCVSERKKEDIETGIQLFNALIEKSKAQILHVTIIAMLSYHSTHWYYAETLFQC